MHLHTVYQCLCLSAHIRQCVCDYLSVCVFSRGLKCFQRQHPASQHAVSRRSPLLTPSLPPNTNSLITHWPAVKQINCSAELGGRRVCSEHHRPDSEHQRRRIAHGTHYLSESVRVPLVFTLFSGDVMDVSEAYAARCGQDSSSHSNNNTSYLSLAACFMTES